jgi:hypothetical protein
MLTKSFGIHNVCLNCFFFSVIENKSDAITGSPTLALNTVISRFKDIAETSSWQDSKNSLSHLTYVNNVACLEAVRMYGKMALVKMAGGFT